MMRWKVWLGNVVLLGVAMLVSVAAGEIAVRIVAPRSTSIAHQDRYGLGMHYPGITRYLPEFDQTVTINSAWMRDVEHPLRKPAGTFRILLLGDSFMEAKQVAHEASTPRLLEEAL
ncbi:MAG: hypothetical protein R3344_12215, partial [Acidobacteriota bacterium]|nr:hypothetical protein [Acidobacteriota bacterium]